MVDDGAQAPIQEPQNVEPPPETVAEVAAPATSETESQSSEPAPEPETALAAQDSGGSQQTAQVPAREPLPPEPEPNVPPTPAVSSPAAPTTQSPHDLLVKANATRQDRKRKKLDKILEALNTKEKMTNDEVEKLLHVSDATATRYLSELEKQGRIKQVGRTGKAVEYTRI